MAAILQKIIESRRGAGAKQELFEPHFLFQLHFLTLCLAPKKEGAVAVATHTRAWALMALVLFAGVA